MSGNLSYTHGYVGVGTSTPLFPLDVIGDARISNNLYVGGGIVISDKIQAITEVKGWDMKVDNDISVEGTTRLKGLTRMDQGFTFDGAKGITYSVNNGIQTFHYGNTTGARPLGTTCAAAPYSAVLNQFGGWLQIYDPTSPTTSGVLNFQTWPIGSSIDASIGSETTTGPATALLLNYFCGNDVGICTGQYGGTVAMGKKVEMEQSLKIGYDGNPGVLDPNTAIVINQNTSNGNGVQVQTWNNSIKAFSILKPDGSNPFAVTGGGNTVINADNSSIKFFTINDASVAGTIKESFVVYGDGKTQIGKAVPIGLVANAKLSVDGLILAREIKVTVSGAYWADYVFDKSYKLMPLAEMEHFIKTNKHLPNVPSTNEIIENGNDLGKTDGILLSKIEECMLYIIELNKQVKELKTENIELKNALNK